MRLRCNSSASSTLKPVRVLFVIAFFLSDPTSSCSPTRGYLNKPPCHVVNLVQMCKKIYTVLLVISPTTQSIAVQNELVCNSSFYVFWAIWDIELNRSISVWSVK